MTQHRTSPRPALALGLAALLVLAAGLTPVLLGTGQAQPDQAGSSTDQQTNGSREDGQQANDTSRDDGQQTNDTSGEGNGSSDPSNRSGQGSQASSRQDRGGQGPPGDRGRADPVEIRDTRAGFASRAPAGSLRPEVAVDAANGSARVERPDVTPLSVSLDTLVEFTDEDGDGAYDVGEPVVERHELRSTPNRIVPDQANATRTVAYELGNGSQLELVFDLGTDHEERVGAKFDVVLEGYDFATDRTRVALGSSVQVDGGLERVTREGRLAVAGQQGDEVAYLSWTPTVQVDGEQRSVASSVHVDAEEPTDSAIVYWAYPQGETIVHDPTLGVTDAIRDLAGRLAPFALGLAATLGLLGVGYAVRARWKL